MRITGLIARRIRRRVGKVLMGEPLPKRQARNRRALKNKLIQSSALSDKLGSFYINRKKVSLFIVATVCASLFFVGAYYYNSLTMSEQDIKMENAQIQSLLQRRHNISVNLARSVRDYAVHEKDVFSHVAKMRDTPSKRTSSLRSGAANTTKPLKSAPFLDGETVSNAPNQNAEQIQKALMDNSTAGLFALAEQYPDLRLSENFKEFMAALVEVEHDICTARFNYTETVLIYSTMLKTFPGNIFGFFFNFQPARYYEADSDAREFIPVERVVTSSTDRKNPQENAALKIGTKVQR